MKKLVEDIARALVNDPDTVEVSENVVGETIVYQIKAKQPGFIIGKSGRTIDSLRTILNAIVGRQKKKAIIEVTGGNKSCSKSS